MILNPDPVVSPSTIRTEAGRCVMCGLCLPHCPTYALTHNEAESPRGRIAMLHALADGHLDADRSLARHIDHCLGCRACEAMCPSGVRFERLLADGRQLLRQQGFPPKSTLSSRLAKIFLYGKGVTAYLLQGLVALYRISRLQRLIRHDLLAGRTPLGRMEAMLPDATPTFSTVPEITPATGEQRGEVALFRGCSGSTLQPQLVVAAVKLLSHLGFAVHAPARFHCCGAFARADGDYSRYTTLVQECVSLFTPLNGRVLLSLASGCGATLRGYVASDEVPGAVELAQHSEEITAFLSRIDWPDTVALAPLAGRVAIHQPCTLLNGLQAEGATERLLGRIPGIDIHLLSSTSGCCGAAGDYMLRNRKMASALRAPRLEEIAISGAQYLVSANVGCALHLQIGLRQRGLDVEVLHPVELLARQMHLVERK